MPFLEQDGTTRELAPGELLVGSGTQAAWRVAGADLAARHFSLAVDRAGAATLRPYSPQNVVAVNGRQVTSAGVRLSSGDRITAGSAVFHFLAAADSPLPPAPAPGQALLVYESQRTAYALGRRTVTVGRDAASTIVVRDPEVSRFHADVRGEAGEYVVYSLGAAGTQVNGQPVGAPRLLVEGDTVRIGSVVLRYTRRGVPSGFGLSEGSEVPESRDTLRATMAGGAAVPGELPRRRRPLVPLAAAAVAAVGAVLYLAAR